MKFSALIVSAVMAIASNAWASPLVVDTSSPEKAQESIAAISASMNMVDAAVFKKDISRIAAQYGDDYLKSDMLNGMDAAAIHDLAYKARQERIQAAREKDLAKAVSDLADAKELLDFTMKNDPTAVRKRTGRMEFDAPLTEVLQKRVQWAEAKVSRLKTMSDAEYLDRNPKILDPDQASIYTGTIFLATGGQS
ncbi:hypothetical protein ACYPKM_04355 [Pseudomonas aeruginosa]